MNNSSRDQENITVELPDGTIYRAEGRIGWAFRKLIQAGRRGCTPIDTPGPRWSHYVWVLRRDGIDIETHTERHGGPFPGNHARYILKTPLRIVESRAA